MIKPQHEGGGTPPSQHHSKKNIDNIFLCLVECDCFLKDIYPYWKWGNSPDDTTKWYERIEGN